MWISEDAGETWKNVFGGISGPTTFQSASDITINAPGDIAGDYLSTPTTAFGSTITSVITADLVLADDSSLNPSEGCEEFGAEVSGKIALIRRGSCNFTVKVKNGKVYVSLAEQLLFGSGSINVDAKGVTALQQLAKAIKTKKTIIYIK